MKFSIALLQGFAILATLTWASPMPTNLQARSPEDGAIRIPVKGVPQPEKRYDGGAIRIPVKGVPEPTTEKDTLKLAAALVKHLLMTALDSKVIDTNAQYNSFDLSLSLSKVHVIRNS
ncbi:hypothetical protein BBP40_000739 [Aspergillus hancockii]|nr:hypothetical protein BBP40_000739 [Aspergillus hancockii]